jgi:hypothetical protein
VNKDLFSTIAADTEEMPVLQGYRAIFSIDSFKGTNYLSGSLGTNVKKRKFKLHSKSSAIGKIPKNFPEN